MGSSSSELPGSGPFQDSPTHVERPYVPPVRREPLLRYIILFLVTFATTTLVGVFHAADFAAANADGAVDFSFSDPWLFLQALWYSVGVLAILGAHEFGHYYACRYYGVRSSLPYFLPLWLPAAQAALPWWFPLPTPGTLGAVIRIRQPIATKRQFFDIGIAGPIAGFVVLIPVLIFSMSQSSVVAIPEDYRGPWFGEPLLFQLTASWFFGEIRPDQTVNLHPTGWAAWFGMLATALNLAPVGQLDGGHISYAVFGRRSSAITIAVTLLLVGLLTVSLGYLLWTVLLVAMVLILGPHHPRTMDEAERLDAIRIGMAVFALIMFVLCFTPVPIQMIGM